jgi:hypothetical protein
MVKSAALEAGRRFIRMNAVMPQVYPEMFWGVKGRKRVADENVGDVLIRR